MERRQKLKKAAEHRRHKLEDCRKYNSFLQDIMEVVHSYTCTCTYECISILVCILYLIYIVPIVNA